MKHIKSYKDFALNEAFSKSVVDKLTIKFKAENPDLTDNQINYYIEEFDKMKSSPKVIEKDILKYSFTDLEKLIDSFPKKVNKSLTGLDNLDNNDIVYDENNLLILKGDTKEKCIKYGRGYKWCISRTDSSNMFNTYRYRYDEINFYFIFDKDKPDTDDNRSLVLLVDKEGEYYLANASNSGDFAGTKEFSYDQICGFQPKLKELKYLFKPLPLTAKEKEIYNKIKGEIGVANLLDYLGSYEIVEAYISFGHELTVIQYSYLTDDLKSKYINLGHKLSDIQLSKTSNKLRERYDYIHSFQYWLDKEYSKEEQRNLTEIYCSNNKLTSLKGIENLTNLTNLTYLDCGYNELKKLDGIENLKNLRVLRCGSNQLMSLNGIENLTNLTYLDCGSNELKKLDGIENLKNLRVLRCGSNQLMSLNGIENLTNLELLYCSYNSLGSLNDIKNLTKLTSLSCQQTFLRSLKGIENLTELTYLNCCHNNLESLNGIENLTNLTELNCEGNSLSSLKGVENLINLEVLHCRNNFVEFNKPDILRKIKNGESID